MMLSLQDARLAEAYAAECEAQVRRVGRSHPVGSQQVVGNHLKSARTVSGTAGRLTEPQLSRAVPRPRFERIGSMLFLTAGGGVIDRREGR
jgi:hypothetical protein